MYPLSLRARLLTLVLLAIIPALGLILYNTHSRQIEAEGELRKNSMRIARLAANNIELVIEGQRQLLTAMSEVPSVRNRDTKACGADLMRIKQHFPLYTNMVAFTPEGDLYCSAVPFNAPLHSTVAWLRRAKESREFSVGDYQMGLLVGKPILVSGLPVMDGDDNIVSLIGASIDLDTLNKTISATDMPEQAVLTVIDSGGIIIARNPDADKWVGKQRPDALRNEIVSHKKGVYEGEGIDGIRRIYAYYPINGTSDNLFISVGVPKEIAFKKIKHILYRDLTVISLIFLLTLAAVFVIADLARRSELEIRRSLLEKEMLLKEVHHRVKNNLSVICGLLSMQANYVKNDDDRLLFDDSIRRIKSMALIHDRLYRSGDFVQIDFKEYVESLIKDIFYTHEMDIADVDIVVEVGEVSVSLDTAVPCGLIINELLTNAVRHAYAGVDKKELLIGIKRCASNNAAEICIIVKDNGVGLPKEIDLGTARSLGMILVSALVEQIDGRIEIDRTRGTTFKIVFPQRTL